MTDEELTALEDYGRQLARRQRREGTLVPPSAELTAFVAEIIRPVLREQAEEETGPQPGVRQD
jgi:hypothetical protein